MCGPTRRAWVEGGIAGPRLVGPQMSADPGADTVAEQIDRLLAAMGVQQQARLLTGADYWSTRGDSRVGLTAMTLSDGPAGVRGVRWDERDPSTCLPAPISLAATWDEPLVRRVAGLLAMEARSKGVAVVLAPMVNLQRSPLAGRHFECLSEDPLLSGRIGVEFVRGLQALGVGAAAKHYVGNDSETKRTSVDVRVDERTLREVYLAPFEQVVVDGGVWVVMAAYNRVNGLTMTENPLLSSPLVDEWGFDGVVISDWYAARSADEQGAVRGGLGLVMPGPAETWVAAVLAAVRTGRLPGRAVQDAARRLLTLAARVGALGGGAPDPPAPRAPDAVEVARLLRTAAAAGMVLLDNGRGLLPLDRTAVRRVALIGPQAATGWFRGGGTSAVSPRHVSPPLHAIAAALGEQGRVAHAEGAYGVDRLAPMPSDLTTCPHCGEPGFAVRYRDPAGRIVRSEHRRLGHLVWFGADILRDATVEISARFRADETGQWHIGFACVGDLRLTIDGTVAIDESVELDHDGFAASFLDPPERYVPVPLGQGDVVDITLQLLRLAPSEDFAALTFGVRRPRLAPDQELARAVDLARDADACVVIVGTGPHVESESLDRATLALPGGQDDLVRAVAAANPRTVVVVNAGAPVLMPWRDGVAAVLVAWFPGQEFGTALADVLFGLAEPGGRLPCTWPDQEADVPVLSTRPVEGVLEYTEGLHVGHRAWLRADTAPAYPFGHGLGYTDWSYLHLDVPATLAEGGGATVAVRIRNTGSRPGKEVVQVYLSRPESGIERPVRWLAGFAVVRAGPGSAVVATVHLAPRAFQHWSAPDQSWATEPGVFRALVGRSVTDLRLAADITIKGPASTERGT
jgi:beta-glucosidase